VTHEFLYLPECPVPLLGRDLLTEHKAESQNHLHPGKAHNLSVRGPNAFIMAVTVPTEDEWQLYCQEKGDQMKPTCLLEEFPDVWAEKGSPPLAWVTAMCP
jgi:hypothetical protein